MSYSPQTGLVYIPTIQLAYPYFPSSRYRVRRGLWNTGEDLPALLRFIDAMPDIHHCAPTQLKAWDPVAQREVWRVDHDFFTPAGVLSTAGGLVFQGTGGRFVAYASDTGASLWESRVGVGIVAPPISYAVDGVQYVAIMAGLGGGSLFKIPVEVENEGRVLAYRLDGSAPMPPTRPRARGRVDVPPLSASPETIEQGQRLYAEHCLFCHGAKARNGGMMPDLRMSTRAVHDAWPEIVLGGTRQAKGMASFADALDEDDVEAIHAYVIERALHQPRWLERVGDWLAERICIPAHWMAY
jgi:mono/diheme cytochrome c family protein